MQTENDSQIAITAYSPVLSDGPDGRRCLKRLLKKARHFFEYRAFLLSLQGFVLYNFVTA